MTTVITYAALAGFVLLTSAVVLQRMAWPHTPRQRFAVAAAIAVAWPVAVPAVAFASVALARLVRTPTPVERVGLPVPRAV